MDKSIFDDIRIFLPKYLSDAEQKNLFSELKSFPINVDQRLYSLKLKEENNLFQGDGYKSIIMADYEEKKFIEVKCILLSNTCDVSKKNKRNYCIPYKTFAPIFKLKEYQEALLEDYPSQIKSIQNHIESIRKQENTSMFYLPSLHEEGEEYFVRFDCSFSIPDDLISMNKLLDKRLFVLSNYGFYLFLLKVSIHSSRIQEGINRDK
jgi:hypothetical protein